MSTTTASTLGHGTPDDNQHMSEANSGFSSLKSFRIPINSESPGMKQVSTQGSQQAGNRTNVKSRQNLVGRTIRKLFGKKIFKGIVKSFDSVSKWYKIEYEDGDHEDLEETEVEELLVPFEYCSPFSLSFTDVNVTPRNQKKRKTIKHGSKENKNAKSDANVVPITEDCEKRPVSGISLREGITRYLQKLQANGQNPIYRGATGQEREMEGPRNVSNQMSPKVGTICGKDLGKQVDLKRRGKCLIGSMVQNKCNPQSRTGTVISYNGRKKLYQVKYEDGAYEDFKWKDLQNNLMSELKIIDKKNNHNESAIKTQGEDAFIGRSVRKAVGRKICKGTVVSYDPKSHLYKVRFDAGDEHDLILSELEPILRTEQRAVMKLQPKTKTTVNNKNFDQRGIYLVGKMTSKKFGKKFYSGKVISYDEESDFYKVEYEDGDQEDLEWDELEPTLISDCHQGDTSRASVGKRQRTKKPVKSQK